MPWYRTCSLGGLGGSQSFVFCSCVHNTRSGVLCPFCVPPCQMVGAADQFVLISGKVVTYSVTEQLFQLTNILFWQLRFNNADDILHQLFPCHEHFESVHCHQPPNIWSKSSWESCSNSSRCSWHQRWWSSMRLIASSRGNPESIISLPFGSLWRNKRKIPSTCIQYTLTGRMGD